MRQAVIFCTQPVRGKLYFHVAAGGEEHCLFGQPFRASLWNRYRFGVRLEEALDRSACRAVPAQMKVCEKLFRTIPYIEKEYGLALLRRTRRSSRRRKREEGGRAA